MYKTLVNILYTSSVLPIVDYEGELFDSDPPPYFACTTCFCSESLHSGGEFQEKQCSGNSQFFNP